MDSNFWFYTLSAIPQTLGAIIALTATFIIFKLNHVEERTKKEYDEIKDWVLTLMPEINLHEISKFDDYTMLNKLKDGIKRLDPARNRFGLEDARFNQLFTLYEHVMASHKKKAFNHEPIYPYLEEKTRILTSLLEVRKNALNYLWISLGLSVATIVSSIIFLPLYQYFISCAYVIVGSIVLLAAAAIGFTAYSVWDIAQRNLR